MARGFLSEGKGSYERPVRDGLVGVDVTIRRSTEKAWGIAHPDKPGEIIWLPKSLAKVVEGDTDPSRAAKMRMAGWLAKREGLI